MRDYSLTQKRISNCFVINQERFATTASKAEGKLVDQAVRRSTTSSQHSNSVHQ